MRNNTFNNISFLNQKSREVRKLIVEISYQSKSTNIGSCLSCVDILVSLYFSFLSIRPKQPDWDLRDRFILSKGHAILPVYIILGKLGFFSLEKVSTFNQNNSIFTKHPIWKNLPGIEATSGSLGHGLGIGNGIALAAKISKKSYRTIVLLGDGECDEGSIWESAHFCVVNQLENLIAIIDNNGLQGSQRINEISNHKSLSDNFKAIGWIVYEIDGHNFESLIEVLKSLKPCQKPVAIIAHTIKGKGISFMENNNDWDHICLCKKSFNQANVDLEVL